jgi:DNA excision repair protein ERCC-2
MARYLISHSNVIVYNYHYMLDPKVNGIVDKFLEPESIVVFDEAHNIDNICIEALSITVSKNDVFQATRALEKLRNLVHQTEQDNQQKLIDEYNSIVNEIQRQQRQQSQQGQQQRQRGQQAQTNVTNRLTNRKNNRDAEEFAELVASPVVLPPDLIQQAIPGSIRRARGFLLFLKSFLEFLKGQLLTTNAREFQPKAFLEVYKQELGLHDISACKFAYDRLSILLTTLNITDFDLFSTLIKIASFITQVANYEAGFVVLYEPFDDLGVSDPRILLTCVDASIAIQPLFNKYASVVITSGTLSPMDLYPKMLNFMPYISRQFTMSLNRNVVVPLIITKGNDQGTISTAYAYRDNDTVTAHYGNLVLNLSKQIPDGIVVFFPSYAYMENILLSWNEAKTDPKTGAIKETLISQILRHKLIFVETKDIAETSLSLQAYKKSCDVGRGGIFFSIARGKVSEGIDFNGHYGRAVVMIGVPYQYTRSRTLLARLEFLKTVLDISEAEYLNFDALRQTSQCLGRIVRSKKDYGLMVLADIRYNRNDIQMKLPRWIRNFIKTGESTSLSIDGGMAQVRTFLRDMSTPHDIKYDYGTVLLNKEQAVRFLEKME